MSKVPVGVTSVAGYTVTLAGVVGAVLAFLKGDRSDQTLGVLAAGGVAALAFLSTQLGRYAQAHAAAKRPPSVQVPSVWASSSGNAVSNVPNWLQPPPLFEGVDEAQPGDDAPPEASLHPLSDPLAIPPDEGDADAEGTT